MDFVVLRNFGLESFCRPIVLATLIGISFELNSLPKELGLKDEMAYEHSQWLMYISI